MLLVNATIYDRYSAVRLLFRDCGYAILVLSKKNYQENEIYKRKFDLQYFVEIYVKYI